MSIGRTPRGAHQRTISPIEPDLTEPQTRPPVMEDDEFPSRVHRGDHEEGPPNGLSLDQAGFRTALVARPSGEAQKSLDVARELFEDCQLGSGSKKKKRRQTKAADVDYKLDYRASIHSDSSSGSLVALPPDVRKGCAFPATLEKLMGGYASVSPRLSLGDTS